MIIILIIFFIYNHDYPDIGWKQPGPISEWKHLEPRIFVVVRTCSGGRCCCNSHHQYHHRHCYDHTDDIHDQVRNLTTNFQRMLSQATKEIKKLTTEKVCFVATEIKIVKLSSSSQHFHGLLMQVGLEREQEKLLTVNVELALETKRLLEQQKEWEEQEKVGD